MNCVDVCYTLLAVVCTFFVLPAEFDLHRFIVGVMFRLNPPHMSCTNYQCTCVPCRNVKGSIIIGIMVTALAYFTLEHTWPTE
jgi:hypothetical protein